MRLAPGNGAEWQKLDGLVIGGGDDISAAIYDGELTPGIRVDPERDRMELDLLAYAEAHDLPVLGICRGAQIMNVFRGGDLHIDIHTVFSSAFRRRTALPVKHVTIDRPSRLYDIVRVESTRVNSLHHQAVNRLGSGLKSVARDQAGIVQAMEDDSKRLFIGVQWHPEFLVYHGRQHALFRALIKQTQQPR